jgi:hypothetical protein
MAAIRKLCDVMLEVADGRKKSARFEGRWLNLFGFCLRPGFGALLDDWRIARARKVYHEGLCFEKDVQCQVEWVILWQRVAGGMNAGQQLELYERHKGLLGVGGKKVKGRINRQVEREGLLLLASLEHLPPHLRVELGEELLERIKEEPGNKSFTWALGRLGARVPFYGPLNCVVPPEAATRWAASLLALPELTAHVATAVSQLAARTDDPLRDVEPDFRQEVIQRLEAAGTGEEILEGLRTYMPRSRDAAVRIFGESLPEGLRLLGSAWKSRRQGSLRLRCEDSFSDTIHSSCSAPDGLPPNALSIVFDESGELRGLDVGETSELDADAPAFEVIAHLAAERRLLGQPELDEDGLAARGAALGAKEVATLAEADDAVLKRTVGRPAPVDVDVHRHPFVLALLDEGHEARLSWSGQVKPVRYA